MYKIYCAQRNQYFAEDRGDTPTFNTLEEVREQLISYHSVDNDEESLKNQTLGDIVNGFEWEIHDEDGEVVSLDDLEAIRGDLKTCVCAYHTENGACTEIPN